MKYYVLTGKAEPMFIVDEKGAPAVFDSLEDARAQGQGQIMCKAFGYVILAWENGFMSVEE